MRKNQQKYGFHSGESWRGEEGADRRGWGGHGGTGWDGGAKQFSGSRWPRERVPLEGTGKRRRVRGWGVRGREFRGSSQEDDTTLLLLYTREGERPRRWRWKLEQARQRGTRVSSMGMVHNTKCPTSPASSTRASGKSPPCYVASGRKRGCAPPPPQARTGEGFMASSYQKKKGDHASVSCQVTVVPLERRCIRSFGGKTMG